MNPRFDIHLGPADLAGALAGDVTRGLTSTPKELPPKWFYDELGCKLFDEITGLPEYYPTRRERAILWERADEVVELSGADTLVELGSGTSEKTRILLDAFAGGNSPLRRFIPFDVSEPTLRQASEAIAAHFPRIEVHAVVGDFEHHVDRLPRGGRRLVAFLGGTIGNLKPDGRARLLESLASTMSAGDTLMLGTDLVKDTPRLVAAYDDSAGVSAAFNRNVLSVINRELNADFVIDRFTHVARFDPANEWMEMSLRADGAQTVTVADLGLQVDFADGEEMRTEISAKFRRSGVEAELEAAGMGLLRWWTDTAGDFALSLFRRD